MPDAEKDDGTRLGHDLASEFPEETRRFDAAMDRLRGPREDRVMPENLRVTPPADSKGCVCGRDPGHVRIKAAGCEPITRPGGDDA